MNDGAFLTSQRPNKLLRIAAWGCVIAIVLGYLSEVQAVSQKIDSLDASKGGHAIVVGALVLVLIDLLSLWFLAVWYAFQRFRAGKSALWPVVLLIVTGFAGGLFYYFFYVRRNRTPNGTRIAEP
jgi:hypothetical protein